MYFYIVSGFISLSGQKLFSFMYWNVLCPKGTLMEQKYTTTIHTDIQLLYMFLSVMFQTSFKCYIICVDHIISECITMFAFEKYCFNEVSLVLLSIIPE